MNKDSSIYVAGHAGLVGSAIVRNLESKGYTDILKPNRSKLDLTKQKEVDLFFEILQPEYVFLAAARVGGIHANNTYRADFIIENLQIQTNVISAAHRSGVKKLLFLGSSCIYPKHAAQPITEDELLASKLEYTNEPYAIAKIAGIKLCESMNIQYGTNFMSVMPTNLYGPGDNYDFETSHVLPAMMRKMHLAHLWRNDKWSEILENIGTNDEQQARLIMEHHGITRDSLRIWGTGTPRREFMHVDDAADACVWFMENVDSRDLSTDQPIQNTHVNIGTGEDISIRNLAIQMAEIIGYDGKLEFDLSKPDGTMVKRLDVSRLEKLGWKYRIPLRQGMESVYKQYKTQK